jgi:serine/threonine protein phosphatase PrpC
MNTIHAKRVCGAAYSLTMPNEPLEIPVFQISRRGGREKNEDRMGYCYTRESGLFVLADGMGGHPEGEVAAQIALQTVSALFQRQAKPQIQDVQEFLSGALLGSPPPDSAIRV